MNTKVYIHELITITKQNRARYMQHMTANWSPIGREQRGQLCFGVWGVVGSTGPWPAVLNMWEEDGYDGLARSFRHELGHPDLQDPALATWWAGATDLRSGGFDRILVPHPDNPTIETLCADGVRGEAYAHDLVTVDNGSARDVLDAVVTENASGPGRFGWRLVGGWWTSMRCENECALLWAIPSWEAWAAAEKAQSGQDGQEPVVSPAMRARVRDRQRVLLVDAPLSPLRTGRQPMRADRTDWEDRG